MLPGPIWIVIIHSQVTLPPFTLAGMEGEPGWQNFSSFMGQQDAPTYKTYGLTRPLNKSVGLSLSLLFSLFLYFHFFSLGQRNKRHWKFQNIMACYPFSLFAGMWPTISKLSPVQLLLGKIH